MTTAEQESEREMIRRDSHLALGCAFGCALIVVALLIVLLLAGV